MKITVAKKMMLLISTAILGLFAVSGVGVYQLEKTYTATSYASANSVPSYQLMVEMLGHLSNLRSWQWRHLSIDDEASMRDLEKKIDAESAKLDESIKKYLTDGCAGVSCLADDHEKALFDDIKARLAEYNATRLPVMELSKQ
ncbi:MAG TPA: MCP four helix bundle domain-containing protein, partial [Gallionella sp.]|nr:MCP four helix bundle domain-containing protein [Gallionella sp.]